MTTLSPATDTAIAHRYTAKSLELKLRNKLDLQEELGWPQEPKRAMVCLPAGMSDALGGALLRETLPGILSLPIEILILGKGSKEYGELFTGIAKNHDHRIRIIGNTEQNRHRMLAASDMALFFADPEGLAEVQMCLRYGVVPIAPGSAELENYDPVQERGTAFTFENATTWDCFAALVRALETYRFPFDWKTIQKQCMGATEM